MKTIAILPRTAVIFEDRARLTCKLTLEAAKHANWPSNCENRSFLATQHPIIWELDKFSSFLFWRKTVWICTPQNWLEKCTTHSVGVSTHDDTVASQLTHVHRGQLPHLGSNAVLLHQRFLQELNNILHLVTASSQSSYTSWKMQWKV